jgi:hypothetical protein
MPKRTRPVAVADSAFGADANLNEFKLTLICWDLCVQATSFNDKASAICLLASCMQQPTSASQSLYTLLQAACHSVGRGLADFAAFKSTICEILNSY